MAANIELVFLSVFASVGFAIVFQIRREDLVWAGIGGGLTRVVYLICMAFIPYRIVYAALAACFASLYAEFLASKKKTPATVFLYPSIIPLIPGDLFYYTMGGVVLSDNEMFVNYAGDCALALLGICIGFVVASAVAVYIRRYRFRLSN